MICKACGRWGCEGCGPKRRIEALKYIEAGVAEAKTQRPNDPVRLLTVTFPSERELFLVNADDIREANADVGRFIESIRRKLGLEFEYVKVIEPTKRGRIHVHMISWGDRLPKCTPRKARRRGHTGRASYRCYCTKEAPCVQRLAHYHGLGFVDVRAAWKSRQVVRYVAKYLTKAMRHTQWPRYARRMSASRKFAPTTLGEIHRAWIEHVLAQLDGELLDRPTVLHWEVVPLISRPRLPPVASYRSPPEPDDVILDHSTGVILPVPF